MRVLFISDFTLEQREGGAQLSNSLIIEEGKSRGFEIVEHHHSSSITDFLSSYDLVVNSNLDAISKISPQKFDIIKKLPNSVRLEHDACSYLPPALRKELFKNCKKTFFLTQYHHSFFKELYGDYYNDPHIVYDPIDTSLFKKTSGDKKYDVVYCGFLHELKGLRQLINFASNNPKRHVDIFGWGDGETNLKDLFAAHKNIKFHGKRNHIEIAEIFQKCNAVFHSPLVNEPFCRMIGEALICGVQEIIGDISKIGAYLEFEKVGYNNFKEGCENAASIFWDKVIL